MQDESSTHLELPVPRAVHSLVSSLQVIHALSTRETVAVRFWETYNNCSQASGLGRVDQGDLADSDQFPIIRRALEQDSPRDLSEFEGLP